MIKFDIKTIKNLFAEFERELSRKQIIGESYSVASRGKVVKLRNRSPLIKHHQRSATMIIKYALVKNNLHKAAKIYQAKVYPKESIGLYGLARRMGETGLSFSQDEIIRVLESAVRQIQTCLQEGRRVNFGGLFSIYPKIKGKFRDPGDSFDAGRHRLGLTVSPGPKAVALIQENGRPLKVTPQSGGPNPVSCTMIGAVDQRTLITPAAILLIHGSRLKFHQEKEDEGIFFRNFTGLQIKVAAVIKNSPSELIFQNPQLNGPGPYTLEVRARMRTGRTLKIGVLPQKLRAVI